MSPYAGIPAPPISALSIGPATFHLYAICIVSGVLVAVSMTKRVLISSGFDASHVVSMAYVAVPVGIAGARFYHLATDLPDYLTPESRWWHPFAIWRGGLSIWGGLAAGALTLIVMNRTIAHRGQNAEKQPFPSAIALLGAAAPGVAFAQAIGRLGNWFNQELFGRPTTLPWALHVDPQFRPSHYESFSTFHPTFAYESLWMVIGGVLLVLASRRLALEIVLSLYGMWYAIGRFVIESLRIDRAPIVAGLRFNGWVSLTLFAISAIATLRMATLRKPTTHCRATTPTPEAGRTVRTSAESKRMAQTHPTGTVSPEPTSSEGSSS